MRDCDCSLQSWLAVLLLQASLLVSSYPGQMMYCFHQRSSHMHPSFLPTWRSRLRLRLVFFSVAAIKLRFRAPNQEKHELPWEPVGILSWDDFFARKETSEIVSVGQTFPWSLWVPCDLYWVPGGGLGLTDWRDAPETERAREAGPNHPHQQT